MLNSNRSLTWTAALALGLTSYALLFLMVVLATPLHAQTFSVLHTFAGGQDGKEPSAGLAMDRAGNLY
jgi:hypothetical protein